MNDKKNELTPEQLEKVAGGVSNYTSSSSSGYNPPRFKSSSSTYIGTHKSSSSSSR